MKLTPVPPAPTDTGLRDISTLLSESWKGTIGKAYIRRYNRNQVDLVLYNLSHAGAEFSTILDLPDGFGGITLNAMPRILFHTSSAATFRSYFSTVRRLAALPPHPLAGSQSFGSATYSTNDPWPVVLPGTPVF